MILMRLPNVFGSCENWGFCKDIRYETMSELRIRYRVKARLYKPGKNRNDLILVDRFFEEENPVEARVKAFHFFQSYKEVLLENINQPDGEGFLVENALNKYISSTPLIKVAIPGTSVEIDPDFDKGIFLYFMSSEGEFFNISPSQQISSDMRVIHHVANGLLSNWTELVEGLIYEYQIYKKYNLDCRDLEKTYDFSHSTDRWKQTTLLETPFGIVWKRLASLKIIDDPFNSDDRE